MTDSIEKFYTILNTIQSQQLRCESLSLTYIGEDDLEICFAENTPSEVKIDGAIPEVTEKLLQILCIPDLVIGAFDFYFDDAQSLRYEKSRAQLIRHIIRVISNQQICRNIDWLTIDIKSPVEVLQIAALLIGDVKNFSMITSDDQEHPTPITLFQNIPNTNVQNVKLDDLQTLLKVSQKPSESLPESPESFQHFMKSTTFENCEIRYESLTKQEIREGFDKDRVVWPHEGGDMILCPGIVNHHRVGVHFEDGKVTFFKQFT